MLCPTRTYNNRSFCTNKSLCSDQLILATTGIILDTLLSWTFSHKKYHDALEAIEMLCTKNESKQILKYTIDIAEVLYDCESGDSDRRLQYWINIREMFLRRWERLDIRMLLLARMMEQLYACKDIGSTLPTETIPASVTSPLYRNLRGKKRVFYSITKMPRNVVKTPY